MRLLRRVARARLASRVIRQLRYAGVTDAGYDSAAFAVRFRQNGPDGPVVLWLDNLLAELPRSRRQRRERVARFVHGFIQIPDLPAQWDEVCSRLRPVLRGTTPMSPLTGISAPIRRSALPHLAEYVVVDQADTMTYVARDQLAGWGVTEDEVFAAARANLSVAVRQPAAPEPVVLRFVDDGNAYWTSHLLIDGWLAGLSHQVGGDPVAFAPERGTLLVAADGSEHLPGLFVLAEETFAASPRAISPMAYVSDLRGRTVPYRASAGPLRTCVQRAEALLAVHEYAHQARLLAGGPTPPLPLLLVGSAEDGWRTRAVWTRDEPALLPEAGEVLMGPAVTPWAAVVRHLTRVPGSDPPRWHTTGWPPA